MRTPARMGASAPLAMRIASLTLALAAATITAAAPLAGQACLGTGLSEGGGAVRAETATVSSVTVLGAAVFLDPASPFGAMGLAEFATIDGGHGLHLGGRGVYQMGPPLGTTFCLTLGASFYQSEGRFRDSEGGHRPTSHYRIYSPTAGLAVGFPQVRGPLVINPYGLAEGHLVYKQFRFGDDSWGGSDQFGGYSNEARAVVAVGVGLQWRRLLLDGAFLSYPGTHSLLEAFRGSDEAGGNHAGFRLALGLVF